MKIESMLGERISKARIARGYSIEQLARRVGVKPKTLKNWETERSSPRANRIMQLAGTLDVPMFWLLAGSDVVPGSAHSPRLQETAELERKITHAEALVGQLSDLLEEIRSSTERVQRDIDEDQQLDQSGN